MLLTYILSPLLILTVIGVVFYALERSSNVYVRRFGPVPIFLTVVAGVLLVLWPRAKLEGLDWVGILWQVVSPVAAIVAFYLLEAWWLARVLARRVGSRFALYLFAYVPLGGMIWAVTFWIMLALFAGLGL